MPIRHLAACFCLAWAAAISACGDLAAAPELTAGAPVTAELTFANPRWGEASGAAMLAASGRLHVGLSWSKLQRTVGYGGMTVMGEQLLTGAVPAAIAPGVALAYGAAAMAVWVQSDFILSPHDTCGGTLLLPQLVLTSSSCATQRIDRFTAYRGGDGPPPGRGPAPAEGGTGIREVLLTPGAESRLRAGFVVLKAPLASAPAVPWATTEQIDRHLQPGAEVQVVGHGIHDVGRHFWQKDRWGRAALGNFLVNDLDQDGMVLVSNPSEMCIGDEGSPVFMRAPAPGQGVFLVGVVAARIADDGAKKPGRCTSWAYVQRVDTLQHWLWVTRQKLEAEAAAALP